MSILRWYLSLLGLIPTLHRVLPRFVSSSGRFLPTDLRLSLRDASRLFAKASLSARPTISERPPFAVGNRNATCSRRVSGSQNCKHRELFSAAACRLWARPSWQNCVSPCISSDPFRCNLIADPVDKSRVEDRHLRRHDDP